MDTCITRASEKGSPPSRPKTSCYLHPCLLLIHVKNLARWTPTCTVSENGRPSVAMYNLNDSQPEAMWPCTINVRLRDISPPERFGRRLPNILRGGNLSQPTNRRQHPRAARLVTAKYLPASVIYAAPAVLNSVLYSIVNTVSVMSRNALPATFMKLNFVFIAVDIPSA
jgi:hypothetical protein